MLHLIATAPLRPLRLLVLNAIVLVCAHAEAVGVRRSTETLRADYSPPFSTSGGQIIDSHGARVQLSCVNWYGAHLESFVVNGLDKQPIASIARRIRELGFNCARLPFSTQLVVSDPILNNATVIAANPSLLGVSAMHALDEVVRSLGDFGVFVILNNHIGRAGWCCSESDGEGLWYTAEYAPEVFFQMWQQLARRYPPSVFPHVVGADLRNELRAANGVSPTWGSGDNSTNWAAAAEQCGDLILNIAPHWLVTFSALSSKQQSCRCCEL
jgi:endoglucanase